MVVMRNIALLSLLAMSCGYSSQYGLRIDGRARAVWQDDHVEVDTSGAPMSPACMQQVAALSHSPRLRLASGELQLSVPIPPVVPDFVVVTGEFWVPRFYGPFIIVSAPGIAPLLPRPPLFIPPLTLHAGPPAPGTAVVSGGGGGGSVGDGRALEVLAAIALIVLPAVAVGLAASRPDDTSENAEAIDQVNAFNDLLRSAGSPCTPTGPPS
jgi:hypothetical protein